MYDVAYLKYLLKDETFVSYFNVYLNLPVSTIYSSMYRVHNRLVI